MVFLLFMPQNNTKRENIRQKNRCARISSRGHWARRMFSRRGSWNYIDLYKELQKGLTTFKSERAKKNTVLGNSCPPATRSAAKEENKRISKMQKKIDPMKSFKDYGHSNIALNRNVQNESYIDKKPRTFWQFGAFFGPFGAHVAQ